MERYSLHHVNQRKVVDILTLFILLKNDNLNLKQKGKERMNSVKMNEECLNWV